MFQNNRIAAWAIAGLLLINTVLIVLLLRGPEAPAPSTKEDRGERRPMGEGGPRRFMEETLNFTPEQSMEFGKLIEQHRYDMSKVRDSIRAYREVLSELLKKDSSSDAEANALAEKIGRQQADLEMINYRHFRDVRGLCTEEQIPAFDSIIQEAARAIAPGGPGGPPPHPHGEGHHGPPPPGGPHPPHGARPF